jgi:hypothetical protein
MTLFVDYPAGMRNITEISKKFGEYIFDNEKFELNIDSCEEIDLSFIQLVESVRKYAKAAGKEFKLSGPAQGAVLATLRRAGFLDSISPEDSRFWLQREEN